MGGEEEVGTAGEAGVTTRPSLSPTAEQIMAAYEQGKKLALRPYWVAFEGDDGKKRGVARVGPYSTDCWCEDEAFAAVIRSMCGAYDLGRWNIVVAPEIVSLPAGLLAAMEGVKYGCELNWENLYRGVKKWLDQFRGGDYKHPAQRTS